MKIMKSHLLQIIKEELQNEIGLIPGKQQTPDASGTPTISSKNQLTSVIAILTMLISDTTLPVQQIQNLKKAKEELAAIQQSLPDKQ